jgi:hypothetical protein
MVLCVDALTDPVKRILPHGSIDRHLHAVRNAVHRQWKDFCCLRGAGNTQTFNPSFARGKTQKASRNFGPGALSRLRP